MFKNKKSQSAPKSVQEMTTLTILSVFFTYLIFLQVKLVTSNPFPQLPRRNSRILDGIPAGPGEIPYQISLRGFGKHYCGAVLAKSPVTSTQFVLTAAECVANNGLVVNTSQLTLMAGSTFQNDLSNDTAQVIPVRKIVPYEAHRVDGTHNVPVPYNDIAIIFPSKPFEINQYVKPIPLPNQDDDDIYHQKFVRVSGWGRIEVNPTEYPNYLQVAMLPLVEHDNCSKMYSKVYRDQPVILQSNICAGGDRLGACHQDYGGPAVGHSHVAGEHKDDDVLLGIFSWGYGCGRPNFPGVYVKIQSYLHWITKTVVEEQSSQTWEVSSAQSWGEGGEQQQHQQQPSQQPQTIAINTTSAFLQGRQFL